MRFATCIALLLAGVEFYFSYAGNGNYTIMLLFSQAWYFILTTYYLLLITDY